MTRSLLLSAMSVAFFTLVAAPAANAQKDELELTPAVLTRFVTAAERHAAEITRRVSADPALKAYHAKQLCWAAVNARAGVYGDSASVAEEKGHASAERLRAREAAITEEGTQKCEGGGKGATPQAGDKAAYQKCIQPFEVEVAPIVKAGEAAQKKNDAAGFRKAMEQAEAIARRAEAKCGPDPDEKSDFERREEAQHHQAEQTDAEIELQGQLEEIEDEVVAAAAAAGNFTERQYAIVKERVLAFLHRQRGSSSYNAYKFSASEMAALRAAETRLAQVLRGELY
jgi:hypothetical protein